MIYVLGSINFDLVVYSNRFPEIGETIKGSQILFNLGGKGANQAISAKKLNGEVLFIGRLGSDFFGKFLIDYLNEIKLNYQIKIEKEINSGIAIINVDSEGRNKIVLYEGANGKVGDEEIDFIKEKIKKDDLLLLQGEIPIETIYETSKIAFENGAIVIFDPAPAKKEFLQILPYVTYLTPNEIELETLTSKEGDFEKKLDFLIERGAYSVIAKLGEKGIFYKDKEGRRIKIDAYKVNAIDTTAAGDIFNGAFASSLNRGVPLYDSLKFSVAASGISVTRKGASISCPNYEEVIKFMEERDEKNNY
ncbi:MAG: ribokinase [Caldisericia bacterium]|nr:ribokinase [Caldisericia bacterium]